MNNFKCDGCEVELKDYIEVSGMIYCEDCYCANTKNCPGCSNQALNVDFWDDGLCYECGTKNEVR